MPYLIIGIDPGHTVGVAALDLSGRLLHTAHVEGDRLQSDGARTGLAGAISLIEIWGTPSLIATDVRPAPDMALKLAASFNVPLFVPQRNWREEDKRAALKEMVEKAARAGTVPSGTRSSLLAENAHERDALSAAIAAWRAEQNLLRKAEGENVPSGQIDRFKHLLLQGYRHDFALQKINDEQARPQAQVSQLRLSNVPSSVSTPAPSSSHLMALERANAELRKRVAYLEHEQAGYLHRIRLLENGVSERMLNDRTLRTMQAQITRLQSSLRQTYARLSSQKGKSTPPVSKSSNAPAKHSAPASKSKPAHPASSASVSSAVSDPPPLKTFDEPSVLEKLVSEYRRGRRG